MAAAGPRFDLPAPDPETQPFWDAARAGTLLIRRCRDCGRFTFYPRPFCPVCWSTNVEWVEAGGQRRCTRGRWCAATTCHRSERVPAWRPLSTSKGPR
jgi:uncharacterized OB-fold protein